ncbi:helix-turn-helix domain-containing protein [Streptomyces sp. NPDC090303]|uniref:helix-turn-helix domain-containing protein n=1 Tax=Streptomyces sp. NPDC090303 TaxID=3365960 RepID=UPI003811ECF6
MRLRLLGASLRRIRDDAGLIGEDVVHRGGIGSKSTLSRIENGETNVKLTEDLLNRLLRCYNAPRDSDNYLSVMSHWQALSSAEEPWWSAWSDVVPARLHELMDLERTAARIDVFEAVHVPGLLQTPPYMSAVMAVPYRGREKDQKTVDRRRKVRRERQHLLDQDDAPDLTAYLEESLLYKPFGGATVLREQLRHLLNLCDARDNIHIRVFPHAAYEHAGPLTPSATLLTFPKDQTPREALYVEAPNTAATWVHDQDDVEIHRASLLSVALHALDKSATLELLQRRIDELTETF